jgi:hypothetical protein
MFQSTSIHPTKAEQNEKENAPALLDHLQPIQLSYDSLKDPPNRRPLSPENAVIYPPEKAGINPIIRTHPLLIRLIGSSMIIRGRDGSGVVLAID